MSYMGKVRPTVALTSSDIVDGAITTDKVVDDAVTADKVANAINTSIAANTAKVTNATHTGDVTGATALTIATDAVDIAMLSATGTASSSTFLRGDNAWVTPSGGKVLQVVQGTLAGVVSTTSGTFSDTGLDASITCSATSSKVLVTVTLVSCYQTVANKSAISTLFRDIGGGGYSNIAPAGDDAFYTYFATSYSFASPQTQNHNYEILDSPNTTSAITYKVYFEVETVSTLNVNQNGTTSYIVLKEIGA